MKFILSYNESLEERTKKAFQSWIDKLNLDDEEQKESILLDWLKYKPYFSNKDIFSYKNLREYYDEYEKAKERYFSKLKNVQKNIDYKTIHKQKILLSNELAKQLINTPETGMGYHRVDLYLKNGEVLKNKIVLNCSILTLEKSINITVGNIEKLVVLQPD